MLDLIKKHWIIIAVIAVVIVILIIVVVSSRKKSDEPSAINPMDVIANNKSLYKIESFPLSTYMNGPSSMQLQKELIRRGANLKADGFFGPYTEKELLRITGLKIVTEEDLNRMINEDLSMTNLYVDASIPDISTDNGLQRYINKLYNNLVVVNTPLGRNGTTEGGLYSDLAIKNLQDFQKIYSKYNEQYKRDLATDVKNATFQITTSVDKAIIDRAIQLGLVTK